MRLATVLLGWTDLKTMCPKCGQYGHEMSECLATIFKHHCRKCGRWGARKFGLPRVTRGSPDTRGSPPRAHAAVPKVLQVREMLQMSRRWFSVHPVRHLVACLKAVLRLCCAGGADDVTGVGSRARSWCRRRSGATGFGALVAISRFVRIRTSLLI